MIVVFDYNSGTFYIEEFCACYVIEFGDSLLLSFDENRLIASHLQIYIHH